MEPPVEEVEYEDEYEDEPEQAPVKVKAKKPESDINKKIKEVQKNIKKTKPDPTVDSEKTSVDIAAMQSMFHNMMNQQAPVEKPKKKKKSEDESEKPKKKHSDYSSLKNDMEMLKKILYAQMIKEEIKPVKPKKKKVKKPEPSYSGSGNSQNGDTLSLLLKQLNGK
jgi:paraquat-inducible protein B